MNTTEAATTNLDTLTNAYRAALTIWEASKMSDSAAWDTMIAILRQAEDAKLLQPLIEALQS